MAASQVSEVVQHLRATVLLQEGAGLTDGQLLGCFLEQRDGAAFAALVRRHGPLVWGVCRRLLNGHDAEDAFQATFLVLVRKAASIVPREKVANWLYGVAHQTALQARRNIFRRRAKEKQVTKMPEPTAADHDLWRDLQPLLDQELSRLPDAYREVIVLSDLEGKTRKETARQLGLPEGTVGSRLARARTMLAKRLARQGVTLSGGALVAALSQQAAAAGVPNSVVVSTIQAASLLAAGKAAAAGTISLKVAALTEGVIKTMFLTKLKTATAVVMAFAFVAALTIVIACQTVAGEGDKTPVAEPPVKTQEKKEPVDRPAPSGKPETAKGLKLTLSADKTETMLKPGSFYGADPVKLKVTFTNTGDKPIKLNAYDLPFRIQFHCHGPSPDSVKKYLVLIDRATAPTEKDYLVLQPGKSWSPSWTPAFPGDIPDGDGAVAAYSLRQPGIYKLRMTVYDRYAPHVEGAAQGTKWLESNELEVKVRAQEDVKKKPVSDQELLQGTWVAISCEANGKVDPIAVEKGLRLTIEGNRFTLGQELALHFPHGTFTLDAGKQPRAIDLTQTHGLPGEKPVLIPGIYEFDGATLKICRAVSGGKRPTDFTTRLGSGNELLIFRRPAVPPPGGEDSSQQDLKKLQGSWVAATLEENAVAIPLVKPLPAGAVQHRMIILTFKDNSFRLEDGNKAWRGTFSIDSKAKPKTMDFTWKRFGGANILAEQTLIARAIYDLSGKTLKVRHGLRTTPGGRTGNIISVWGKDRPKDFGPGPGWETIVYHRIPDMPKKSDSTAVLLEALEEKDYPFIDAARVRAAAIDLLKDRKAKQAIPKLIELLTDGAGLRGSDNYVGVHAADALSAITGRPFSMEQKEWQRWWRAQRQK